MSSQSRTSGEPRWEDLPVAFSRYLARQGLKATRQRELIVAVFAAGSGHCSVDELLELVNREDPAVGYATVYRTLKLLVDAGLASERQFGDGYTRFEIKADDHHDHMICEECSDILEFSDVDIERRQEQVASQHGFKIRRHKHELYGICARCQERENTP